jgi:hypothetical protein
MCALVPAAPLAAPADAEAGTSVPMGPDELLELETRERAAAGRVRARAEARQRALLQRELRLQAREIPRLTVGVGMGIAALAERIETDGRHRTVQGPALTLGLGLRKNFTRSLGAHVAFTPSLGKAQIRDRDGELRDETSAFGLGVTASAFYSTSFRLYFGPVASLDARFYGKDTLLMFGRPYSLNPDGPIHGSLGGEVGVAFFAREQMDVSMRVAAGLPEALPQFWVSLRYHLLTQAL